MLTSILKNAELLFCWLFFWVYVPLLLLDCTIGVHCKRPSPTHYDNKDLTLYHENYHVTLQISSFLMWQQCLYKELKTGQLIIFFSQELEPSAGISC